MPIIDPCAYPQSSLVGRTKNQQYLSLATSYDPFSTLPPSGTIGLIEFLNIFAQLGSDIQISIPSTDIILAPNKNYFVSCFINALSVNGFNNELNAFLLLDGVQYTPIAANTGSSEISVNLFTTITTGNESSILNLAVEQIQVSGDVSLGLTSLALNIIELD